jgi:hypothetical protein
MAQDISSMNLAANWSASSARVAVGVICDWNRGGFTGTYKDVSSWVRSVSVAMSLYESRLGLPGLGAANPGTATIVLNNSDNWFSPGNASGLVATYPGLANGMYRVPVQVWMGYYEGATAQAICSFTGEIESTSESESSGGARAFRLQCHDVSLPLRQAKLSTTIYSNYRVDALIAAYAALAGLSDTDLDAAMSHVSAGWLDDGNVWEEIVALAQADSGLVYCDELGNLVYRRATAWLERADSTAAVLTLDRGKVSASETARNWQDVYNEVTVEYAPRYRGAVTVVYQAQGPVIVPPNSSITETYQFDYPCSAIITPAATTDYQAASAAGLDLSANLVVSVDADAQRADVTFTNNNAYHAIYVYAFQIRGRPVYGVSGQEAKAESSLGLISDNKAYAVRSNVYSQSVAQAQLRAGLLRDWLQRPRRILTYTGPWAPWLQLGDRIHVEDADAGVDEDCYLLGKDISYGSSLLRAKLSLLPVTDLYAYSSYFRLGSSAYGASADPIFY